ncbi:MAG: hypothetical protein JWN00_2160, partial [Actinomycetia bacterium]|nr:hypothetical protein [Actinomycetes bacterium]
MRIPEVPELLSNDPDGFGWGVLHDRTPMLIAQIRDAHPYGPYQRRVLDLLEEEIVSGTLQPLPHDAHDHGVWAEWGRDYFGKPWAEVP